MMLETERSLLPSNSFIIFYFSFMWQVMDDEDDDSDEEEDDDGMHVDAANTMVNAPTVQPRSNRVNTSAEVPMTNEPPAEDGWEVVSSRRNRGRRN